MVQWSRFQNVCIELEGSTLVTGVNGSGKSTVLMYIIYYQKFLSNFHSLTPRGPKLPARCPLYNTCMITD